MDRPKSRESAGSGVIMLRLGKQYDYHQRIQAAASSRGLSMNAFILRVVQYAVHQFETQDADPKASAFADIIAPPPATPPGGVR